MKNYLCLFMGTISAIKFFALLCLSPFYYNVNEESCKCNASLTVMHTISLAQPST
jgi:hypothetical protein